MKKEIKNYFEYLVQEGIVKIEKDDKLKTKNPFKEIKEILIKLSLFNKNGIINTLSIQNYLMNSSDSSLYISFKIPRLGV